MLPLKLKPRLATAAEAPPGIDAPATTLRRFPKLSQIPTKLGLGANGKPFFWGALVQIYTAFTLIRALATRPWYLTLSESTTLTPENTTLTTDVLSPLTRTTPLQITLLSTAVAFALVAQLAALMRIFEFWHKTSVWIMLVAAVSQSALTIAAFVTFLAGNLPMPSVGEGEQAIWSQGMIACLYSIVTGLFIVRSAVVDIWRTRGENDDIGKSRRKLILANFFAIVIIMLGATGFHMIEGWSFADSSEFAVVTALTIGYGNLSPKSTGSRLFLFLYFVLASLCIGYFFTALEDFMVEKSEAEIIRMAEWKRLRAEVRAQRRLEKSRSSLLRRVARCQSHQSRPGATLRLTRTLTSEPSTPRPNVHKKGKTNEDAKSGGFFSHMMIFFFPDRFNPVAKYDAGAFANACIGRHERCAREAAIAAGLGVGAGVGAGALEEGRAGLPTPTPVKDELKDSMLTIDVLDPVNETGSAAGGSSTPNLAGHGVTQDDHDSDYSSDSSDASVTRVGSHNRDDEDSSLDSSSFEAEMKADEQLTRRLERHKISKLVIVLTSWWLISARIFQAFEPRLWRFSTAWEFWHFFIFSAIGTFGYLIGTLTEKFGSKFAKNASVIHARIERRRQRKLHGEGKYLKHHHTITTTSTSTVKHRTSFHLGRSGSTLGVGASTATFSSTASTSFDNADAGAVVVAVHEDADAHAHAHSPLERMFERTLAFASDAVHREERRRERRRRRARPRMSITRTPPPPSPVPAPVTPIVEASGAGL
ncbi:Potassium channel [Irineochytrium annulatum]|nr:Potassium channel [Irineochytrium annulatum]